MTSQIGSGDAVLLGVVQGLTEFLPISSSGHLVAFQHFLGLEEPELLFDVILHAGTLLAVLCVYARDLWAILREVLETPRALMAGTRLGTLWKERPYLRLAVFLVLGTLPAGLAGVLFDDAVEAAFGSITSVACMLIVTGGILFTTRWSRGPGRDLDGLSLKDCLLVGIAQSFALMPGISRSGTTIAAGMLCGLNRDLAARFSFLLSVPAILGATVLQLMKAGGDLASTNVLPFLVGGGTAFAAGYLALRVLLRLVHGGRLHWFAFYCWAAGAVLLALYLSG